MAAEDANLSSLAGASFNLIPIADPNASARRKAFASGGLASTGIRGYGQATGSSSLVDVGGALGAGLGVASTGLGVYDTATNPNLSTTQKAGHSGELAANLAATLASGGWYGLALAARAITGAMQRSGSPQVSAAGRAIAAPALPVEAGLSVLRGDKSPRAAANAMVASINDIPLVGGAMGSTLRAFGLGTKPTTGTMFRNELGAILPQVGLKGVDTSRYQMPTGGYGGFDPAAVQAARSLGGRLAGFAPHGKGNAEAYGLQAQNVLLNQYGNSIIPMAQKILDQLDPDPKVMR